MNPKVTFSNLPNRNPFFTGREQVLLEIRKVLAENGRAVLSGVEGSGKTQMALEYAHQHFEEYTSVFWATADSKESLVSHYMAIAVLLKLPEVDAQEQTAVVEALKRWLGANRDWLLLLDNADDVGMAREFLPQGREGHVLVTTRARAVGSIGRRIEIEGTGTDEGALFLLRRSKQIPHDAPIDVASPDAWGEAKAIALEFNASPLALNQAGAYVLETGCGLSSYLDCYKQKLKLLEKGRPLTSDHHPDPVATTCGLSVEKVGKSDPTAAELLRFCAFLHPHGIPVELFSKGAPELGPELKSLGSDAFGLNSSISEILKYSLMRQDAYANTLDIDRLVQAVLKQAMDEATQRVWAERAVRAVNTVFSKGESSVWPVCERLLPQAQACAALIDEWNFGFPETAQLLNNVGSYLAERGRYCDAEPLYERVLAIAGMLKPPDEGALDKIPGKKARPVEIQEMRSDEGVLFLLRRAKYIAEAAPLEALDERVQVAAREIVTQLDGLPLALDRAGAYIVETGCGLSDYLEIYREQVLKLIQQHGALPSNYYHDPLASTCALSVDKIEKDDPAASELLRFCAFLHSTGIPPEVFKKGAPELGPVLGPVGSDESALNSAISEVLKYSLMHREANADTLCIDGLVQAVLKQGMDEATQRLFAERAVRAVNRSFSEREIFKWPLCERLLSQAQKCATLIGEWDFDFPEAGRLLDDVGLYLVERRRYEGAESIYQRSLAIREKISGLEHPDVATCLNNLAELYRARGQYSEAEPVYRRSLAIREKILGPEHADVAMSLNNLALLYNAQGQHEEAESFCQQSLAIRKKALGPEHSAVADSLHSLAVIYAYQSQYAKAESFYKRSLAIRERTLGAGHPYVANSLSNLALLYHGQALYENAELLYQQSLAARKKALGLEHPDVANSLNSLAGLYRDQSQYEKAELLYRQSLTIRVKALGLKHRDVANSLFNLAWLYHHQGQYAKAELLYQQSSAILQKMLGPEDSAVAPSLNNLALIYHNQRQYRKAERLYQRSLAIRERALGLQHTDVATSLENYASLLRQMGRREEAMPLEARARAIRA